MAEQNPIKYSDLISPDDSIEKLIGQLEKLNEAYTGMANSVRDQAAAVAASLRSVSGATSQGQQATRNASQEADKLAKAYQNLAFARSETAKKIQELKMAQQEENRITKLQIILNNTEEGSYAHLSAQYSLNKMQLNQLTAAERENLPHAKKLEEETKKIYEEMKRLQEATGKYSLNVGNYTNSITSAIGVNTRWFTSMQELAVLTQGGLKNGLMAAGEAVGALGKKLLALLANPIVATIAAIAAAFALLAKGITSSEENMQTLSRILAPFQRMLTGIVNVLQTMASVVLNVVEGTEKMAMGLSRWLERLPLVGDQLKKVNDALEENIRLTELKNQLEKAERTKNVANAKLARDVAHLKNLAAQTNNQAEKQRLLNLAKQGEQKILKNELNLAYLDLERQQALAKQAGNNKEANEALAQARIRVYKAEEAYYQGTMRLEKQLANIRNHNSKGGSGGGKTTSAVDAAKQQLDEQRKIEDARIQLIEDANVRERMTIITSYNRKIEDLKGNAEYVEQMTVLLEQQKQQKLAELSEKEAQQQRDREKKDLDERLKATDNLIKRQQEAVRKGEEAINQQYELSMSYIELEDSEQKKTEMRLDAEKKRLQALLKLYEQDGKTLTEAELQILRNNIEQVDKEMEKTVKGRDLYDLLGFDMDDDQKEAINEAFSVAMDNLNSYMDALVKAAEQKAQLADKEVDRARSVLDAEIEARNKGYASDVETARKELALAKKNQQQALNEQKRAQRMQEAINAAEQASSLITATANIWKSFTGTGPWGIAAAIAATALMWGSFAAAKIKAVEMTRTDSEEYGEGTVELLEGGSHQSGNDIDLGRKKNGTRRRAEGGEFFAVINKRNSRRYRSVIPDVIGSLNDGTFAQKYMRAYDDGGVAVSVQGQAPDLRGLSSDVRMIREQGEVSTTYDGNGNEVMRYKNLRRIIRR